MYTLLYVGIILYTLSASLHCLGAILLYSLKANSLCSSTQRLTMLNLCCVEMLLALNGIAIRLCVILKINISIVMYVEYFQLIFVNSWYIFLMFFLTVDRLMAVYFNIRYTLVWSSRKTRIVLCLIPTIFLTISATILLYYQPWQQSSWRDVFVLLLYYLLPPCNFLFILVATATYAYLYNKIRQNWAEEKKMLKSLYQQNNGNSAATAPSTVITNTTLTPSTTPETTPSTPVTTTKSTAPTIKSTRIIPKEMKRGFYTPTILILTFMMFWSIPDLVYSMYIFLNLEMPQDLKHFLTILYPIGTVLDALVLVILPFWDKIARTIHRWRRM